MSDPFTTQAHNNPDSLGTRSKTLCPYVSYVVQIGGNDCGK